MKTIKNTPFQIKALIITAIILTVTFVSMVNSFGFSSF